MSQNNRIACVDVPIIPTCRYRAIRSEFSRGQAKAYRVDVSQKLVIVKDRESGAMASYVMSLIPDKSFAAKHKGDISDLFLNANDRGKYSGIVLYTYHGIPVRLSRYIKGKRVEGVSTCGVTDKQQYKELLHKICHGLSGIKVYKNSYIASRAEWDGYETDDEESDNQNTIEGGSEEGKEGGSGGNTGGNSENDRIFDIDEIIVIGQGPTNQNNNDDTTIGLNNPQPDPENPNKNPLENLDDEGDIGDETDGDRNNNNTNNSQYGETIADIASKVSNETLSKLMQDNKNVQFVVNKEVPVMNIKFVIETSGGNTTIKITEILYNPQELKYMSEAGIVIAILHEFMHPYLVQIGQSGINTPQADDHQKLVKGIINEETGKIENIYMQTIRELFPNKDDDFYDVAKYAGCIDCEAFNELSSERKQDIEHDLYIYLYK